jgi:hypothetical protein
MSKAEGEEEKKEGKRSREMWVDIFICKYLTLNE